MSRQITFEEGQIKVAGETAIMIHGPALIKLTDIMIKTMGKKGIINIYLASKEGGESLAKAYKRKFNLSGAKLADLLKDLAVMGGWGKMEFIKLDFNKKILICRVKDSPFAQLSSLRGKKVCHIIRGLLAGGCGIGFNENVDGIETRCKAEGSDYCEFIIQPKKDFKEKNLVKEQL
jgi:predicted hydrocarbon binding protein